MNPLLASVLTSAMTAALVASIFNLLAQALERKARRHDLIFTKSVELAKMKTDFLVTFARDTGAVPGIHDYVAYAEQYYWLLSRLHDEGRLPRNWRDEIAEKFPMEANPKRRL